MSTARRVLLAWLAAATYGDDMASDRQTELRLSRLENDTVSLYDLITEITTTQREHSRRFDLIDRRFESVNERFDSVDQRFDSIESTLAEVVRRLPEPSCAERLGWRACLWYCSTTDLPMASGSSH